MTCPCKSSKNYTDCCGIAHSNIKDVKNAEQLMRSRYSAFALGDSNYLHISHHPSTRPNSKREREANIKWAKSVVWSNLQILDTLAGQDTDSNGIVEFKAFYIENGQMQVIHERSTFEKVAGIWLYKDAI